MTDLNQIPDNLPRPVDDGACDHLKGLAIPNLSLSSTSGERVNLSKSGLLTVVYVYPMTGRPGRPLPLGWDLIPGARGCTPQSCSMRDHRADFERFGATLFGVSTQSTSDQLEAKNRLELPFDLLSDIDLQWSTALRLPSFEIEGDRYLRRVTLVLRNAIIEKVFYPVYPPDANATAVLEYLKLVS